MGEKTSCKLKKKKPIPNPRPFFLWSIRYTNLVPRVYLLPTPEGLREERVLNKNLSLGCA